jgi:hypothetical protein
VHLLPFTGARDEATKLRQGLAEAENLRKKTEAVSVAETEWLRTAIDSLNGTVGQCWGHHLRAGRRRCAKTRRQEQ